MGVLGKYDATRLAHAFEPCGDVDAVAHQVAVAFLDHVAEMNADAKFDATLGRQAGIAVGHAVLNLDRAPHSINHAAELDQTAVACALDEPPMMRVDGGVD